MDFGKKGVFRFVLTTTTMKSILRSPIDHVMATLDITNRGHGKTVKTKTFHCLAKPEKYLTDNKGNTVKDCYLLSFLGLPQPLFKYFPSFHRLRKGMWNPSLRRQKLSTYLYKWK